MKSEGLTSSRLAEILEVQPSGISHILSGRNKPGFDFLQKILRRFPQINPDWLLLDSGAMYRAMQGEMSANQAAEVAGAAGSPAAVGHDTGLPEGYVLPGFDVDAGVGRVSGGSGISPASGAADVSAASGFPVLRVLPIPLHFPGLWGPPVVWMILSPVRIRVP